MKVGIEIVDVGGRFARLASNSSREFRRALAPAVAKGTERLADEMFDLSPPRSDDPPHVKDAIDYESRGLSGKAGILNGGESAGSGDTTMGEVALFNEYDPNEQPFMRPAAENVANDFARDVTQALERAVRSLAVTGL